MGFMSRAMRCAPVFAVALLMAFVHADGAAVAAAKKPQAAAAGDGAQASKQAAAEAAKRAFESGIKSYSAGKYQPAVDQLSAALRGGGLNSSDMARGLYYRGLAYKKQNKPGLAISDLTSALWLKNGLSDSERKSATAERAEAYKAAGLGDGNSGADTVAVSDPKAETPPAPSAAPTAAAGAPAAAQQAEAPAPAPAKQAATDSGIPQPLSLGGEAYVPPAPKVRSVQAAPAGQQVAAVAEGGAANRSAVIEQPASVQDAALARTAAAKTATRADSAATEPVLNAAPNPNGAFPSEKPATGGPSTLSGFFSNLFGGSAPAASEPPAGAPAANVTTASTGQTTGQTTGQYRPDHRPDCGTADLELVEYGLADGRGGQQGQNRQVCCGRRSACETSRCNAARRNGRAESQRRQVQAAYRRRALARRSRCTCQQALPGARGRSAEPGPFRR